MFQKSSIKKLSFENRPCGIRKSKNNPDAYSKTELVELYVKKYGTKIYIAKKMNINQLCNQLKEKEKIDTNPKPKILKQNLIKHDYTYKIENLLKSENKYYVTNLENTLSALEILTNKIENTCPAIDDISDDNIDIFFNNADNNLTNINSILQNTCFIRKILHSIQDQSYKYGLVSLENKLINITFTPYKRIDVSSVEGDAWLIGYKNTKKYIGVLKYAQYDSDGETSQNILHELVIGLVLNNLRQYTPNFMFMYDGFYCSSNIKGDKLSGVCSTDSYEN
jgi:hypothetical protein